MSMLLPLLNCVMYIIKQHTKLINKILYCVTLLLFVIFKTILIQLFDHLFIIVFIKSKQITKKKNIH